MKEKLTTEHGKEPVRRFLSAKHHIILNWTISSKNYITMKSMFFSLLVNSFYTVNSSISSIFKSF